MNNLDERTVLGFGDEWARFDQTQLGPDERQMMFDEYFAVFPWGNVGAEAVGADIGCGSGRWAVMVAPRVQTLHCVDPSDAIEIARRVCAGHPNVRFHRASVDNLPFENGSLDFAYALGVLHHVPDTAHAIATVSAKLKRGAPLLLYLYYAFDNRPFWFRAIWRVSDILRRGISRLPLGVRYWLTQFLAAAVYWPLASIAKILDEHRLLPTSFPLASYKGKSFYSMRTDALDRFGTRLEKRFTRAEIHGMMTNAGLKQIVFSNHVPFWCAVGIKE